MKIPLVHIVFKLFLCSRGGSKSRGGKKKRKGKKPEDRHQMGEIVTAANQPPDSRYADMAPK